MIFNNFVKGITVNQLSMMDTSSYVYHAHETFYRNVVMAPMVLWNQTILSLKFLDHCWSNIKPYALVSYKMHHCYSQMSRSKRSIQIFWFDVVSNIIMMEVEQLIHVTMLFWKDNSKIFLRAGLQTLFYPHRCSKLFQWSF